MLIINGVIHTMETGTVPEGFVLTEGTRIVQVGPMAALPEGADRAERVDARGGHVLPGFIDAHCHVGLYGAAAQEDDLNEMPSPCTPQLRALDGVDPLNQYFAEARRAGVTCVHTGPGSANPIAGQSVLLKTAGAVVDRMAVRSPAAMKFALGENPKGVHKGHGPATRMATAALIRDKLAQALKAGRGSAEGPGAERAAVLYCLYYDNFGFRYYHGTTYEEMLACVDEARAAGVELWQADFTITPESVALTDYHPLEEW